MEKEKMGGVTDSKGEKPSVSELCLHSSDGEMKMVGPEREVDVHFCARKKRTKIEGKLVIVFLFVFLLFNMASAVEVKRCVSQWQLTMKPHTEASCRIIASYKMTDGGTQEWREDERTSFE